MILAMSLALLGASAAPDQVAAPAATALAAPKVKEKRICVADEATTGSLLPRRTCKTKTEWDAEAARAKGADGQQNSSSVSPNSGS